MGLQEPGRPDHRVRFGFKWGSFQVSLGPFPGFRWFVLWCLPFIFKGILGSFRQENFFRLPTPRPLPVCRLLRGHDFEPGPGVRDQPRIDARQSHRSIHVRLSNLHVGLTPGAMKMAKAELQAYRCGGPGRPSFVVEVGPRLFKLVRWALEVPEDESWNW